MKISINLKYFSAALNAYMSYIYFLQFYKFLTVNKHEKIIEYIFLTFLKCHDGSHDYYDHRKTNIKKSQHGNYENFCFTLILKSSIAILLLTRKI